MLHILLLLLFNDFHYVYSQEVLFDKLFASPAFPALKIV